MYALFSTPMIFRMAQIKSVLPDVMAKAAEGASLILSITDGVLADFRRSKLPGTSRWSLSKENQMRSPDLEFHLKNKIFDLDRLRDVESNKF